MGMGSAPTFEMEDKRRDLYLHDDLVRDRIESDEAAHVRDTPGMGTRQSSKATEGGKENRSSVGNFQNSRDQTRESALYESNDGTNTSKVVFNMKKGVHCALEVRKGDAAENNKDSDVKVSLKANTSNDFPLKADTGIHLTSSVALDPAEFLSGIADGTVIAGFKDGVPYVVREPESGLRETAQPAPKELVLDESLNKNIIQNTATHLIIVRHGNWYGFRSGTAGGRFLQARKKGPRKLCFFSQKFGVCEQWELIQSGNETNSSHVSSIALETFPLVFRSRRLPNFELKLDVLPIPEEYQEKTKIPVGFEVSESCPATPDRTSRCTSMPASPALSLPDRIGMNGGSLPLFHGNTNEQGHPMAAMSGILIKEWSSFVTKEVQARQEVTKNIFNMREKIQATMRKMKHDSEVIRKDFQQAHLEFLQKQIESFRRRSVVRMISTNFSVWRYAVEEIKSQQEEESAIQDYNIKHTSFHRWLAMTVYLKQANQEANRLTMKQQNRTLTAVFAGWSMYAEMLTISEENVAASCRNNIKEKNKKICIQIFSAWSSYARSQSILAERCDMLVKKQDLRKFSHIMRYWQAYLSRAKFLARTELMISSTRRSNQAYKAFHIWKQLLSDRKEARVNTEIFVTAKHEENMAIAFFNWRDFLIVKKSLKRMQEKKRMILLREGFYAMEDAVKDKRHSERVAFILSSKANIGMRKEFFAAWRFHLHEMRCQNSKVAQCQQRNNQSTMHSAVIAWFYIAAKKRCLEEKKSSMQRMMKARSVCSAFMCWREFHFEAQRKEECSSQLARDIELQERKRIIQTWRESALFESASFNQTCRSYERQKVVRLRSSAFQMWKNFTEYEKEMADLASVMSNRNSTLRFKTSIQHWLQYAKLHRATKTAYDRVIAKRKRTAMLDSWIAWRQLVADEFARQAKIRACIRSKRVMKDWFVNWYWDAYEDEIRSTLKLLYGTTEDVLGQLYDMYEEMRQADSKNDDVPVRPASTSQSLEAPPISGDPGPNLCILNELQNVDTAEEFCTPTLWSDELEGAKLSRPSPRKELSFN